MIAVMTDSHSTGSIWDRVLGRMKAARKWITRVAAALCLCLAFAGTPAMAQTDEESDVDGRLEGYDAPVRIEKSGTTMMWALFFFLAIIGCSVLFKSAKRTHLD